jgi:PAS domain S-box-containing protein
VGEESDFVTTRPSEPIANASELLQRFIVWTLALAVGLALLNIGAYAVSQGATYLLSALMASGFAAALGLARLFVRQGRLYTAIGFVVAGLLAATLLTAVVDSAARPLFALLPLLAITVALPFLKGPALVRLIIGSSLTAVAAALIAEFSAPPDAVGPLYAAGLRVSVSGITVALLALILWQLSVWLHGSLGRLEATSRELQASRSQLQALVEYMPVMVNAFDDKGQIILWNRESERVTGYSAAEMIGNPRALELLYPEEAYREQVTRELLLGGSALRDWERTLRRKDGDERTIAWSSVPEQIGADGTARWSVGVDVTARKRTEEQRRVFEAELRNRQKLESLGVLTGGIAHDFNNLLGIILGNAELALLDLPASHPASASVETIITSAQRAGELTRQMMAFAGRRPVAQGSFDLNTLIDELSDGLRRSVPQAIAIKYRLEPDLVVKGDMAQIRQLVTDLVANASEAIGADEGTITLSTYACHADRALLESTFLAPELPEGDYVALEVADTGAGMDTEMRARIFEPFFTTKFVGRGMGLPAVLGIVQAHLGAVKVESEPDRGTVLTVLLPAQPQGADAA